MIKKWVCTVCGYIHEGDTPPEICPLCGVGPDMFKEMIQSSENISDKKEKNIKIWECTICGYIYEGTKPPEYCPICGVGPELFEEVKKSSNDSVEKGITFSSDLDYNILIIGNGIAGISAAKSIRQRNKNCKVTIISDEKYITYYRPQLTGLIGNSIENDKLYLYDEQWYKDNNINLKLNTKVNSINTESHSLTLESGEDLTYDKLILANGSSSFIPPIPGNDKKGTFTLRNLKDLMDIKNYIKMNSCKKVSIIGGGLLGLEAAESFQKQGLKVNILERSPRLLTRQLDDKGSKLFEYIVESSGINVLKNANAEEVLGDTNVTGLKLSSGKILDTDLVLFSVGITPNINLFKNTTLEMNRGVVVNDQMKTNIKDMYACGDIAELNGLVFGTWTSAEQMGTTAGANCLGDNLIFKNFVSSTMLQALNTTVFSCGNVTEDETVSTVVLNNSISKIYKKLFFKDEKIVGCILIGDSSKSINIINYIKEERKINDIINNF
ncbi:FAD-dependent oxidoreductase [Haloimpatiens massiliensis]|uniref:FAD-dependent oxidoreductase n=1 Tax=Haloimpatiens massiliensis TaxID=1658110 RepID=UPI001FA8C1CF|nr:FAD-dependent oxidoreductase [Haloimpatiens massiliensis]